MESKEILKKLVGFNTIEDKENKQIMDYIQELLTNKGFKTDYRSKCLVMSIKDSQDLGFLGHTDTVKASEKWIMAPFEMTEKDGVLYGLGVCDMKGGIAAILGTVIDTDWAMYKKGIKLYFTYDEEIGFLGINELLSMNEKFPDNMVIGEPTDNEIMYGSKGLLQLKIKFDGKAAHASTPQKGENAIEKCIGFINEFVGFYNKIKEEINKDFEIPYTTMNIGKIEGGNGLNVVPNSCEVMFDFRPVYSEHTALILEKIEELLKKYSGIYELIERVEPFVSEGYNIKTTNFITEASLVKAPNRYILGVGPVNPHEADEHITIESLEKLTKQYKEMINKFCN